MSFEDAARATRVYHLPGPVPFHYFRGFIPGTLGAPLINHNYVSRGGTRRIIPRASRILIVRDESIYGAISESYRDYSSSHLARLTRVCINYLN